MVEASGSKIIFRCDDVSPNTDMRELNRMYGFLKDNFDCDFWSVVSLFAKGSSGGSVYPNPPFKDKSRDFFYKVDALSQRLIYPGKTVSHGLIHVDHSVLQFDAQEMSIMTSCEYLNADTFVPPFNRYNAVTEAVCRINKINLVRYEDGWKCMDRENFDPSHRLWYFHPWRFNFESFKEKLSGALSH